MDPVRQPGLVIDQIFLADVEFHHRQDALDLPANTRVPELTVDVSVRLFEVEQPPNIAGIAVRVNTRPEDEPLYLFSVELMAVIGAERGQENMAPFDYVATLGASMLFPFIREAVGNLTMRGRFGPVWLKPINIHLALKKAEESARAAPADVPRAKPKRSRRRKSQE